MSGPTGTTVESLGRPPDAGLRGRCCELDVVYRPAGRSAAADEDDEEEEDIGRSAAWPPRVMHGDCRAQGAGAQSA